MLKAFLLTAGFGTRLRPLTNKIPKCLLPIADKPLLEIWLEHLYKHRIDEVLINTCRHHEKVEKFIDVGPNVAAHNEAQIAFHMIDARRRAKGYPKSWPRVRLFNEADPIGTAETLLQNKNWVDDGRAFFILYGDNLTNVNLTKMYAFHCDHGLPFTLGLFWTSAPAECGIAEVNEKGIVTDFVEKPSEPKSNLAAAGIYIADKRIFDFFPTERSLSGPFDLGYHVIPNLIGNMKAYFIEDFLIDIGTPESYEKAQIQWPQRLAAAQIYSAHD